MNCFHFSYSQIVGLALAANSMLAGASTLRQQQLVIGQAVKPIAVPDHYLQPPEAPVPEPIVEGAVNLDGTLAAPIQGTPYSFGYEHSGEHQSSSRSESSDGKKVTGHYTLQGADGIHRIVHYVADFDGFRASIQTNEPGTESHNPSGVLFQSNQLPAAELSRQYGPVAVVPAENAYAQPAPAPFVVQPSGPAQPLVQAQPFVVAFGGQQQQQEEEEEEEPAQQQEQQQQQQEEEPAPIKSRPVPTLAPIPPPPPSTTTSAPIVAPVKGRPIKIQQQPTKSIVRPIQAPIKAPALAPAPAPAAIKGKPAPAPIQAPIKGKVIIQPAPVQAPIKAKPAPVVAPAPIAAPVKGRPPVKSVQAPIKSAPVKRPLQQPVFVPRPVPAILPVPAPAKTAPTTARPEIVQQPQQQQEEEEPQPQQQQQQQSSEQVFDEGFAHEEGLAEQDF